MILIVDCGSKKSPFIKDFVNTYAESVFVTLEDFNPASIDKYNGIIISGAPILVTEIDPKPYLDLFAFLITYDKPVFGICFGHQILGMLHGAYAEKCTPDRSWQNITRSKQEHPILKNFPESFKMMEDHCECISLPVNFKLLGSSSTCQNEIMIHENKAMLGVQFHPEVSDDNGKLLFENFFNNFFSN